MKIGVHLPQISPNLTGADVRRVAVSAEEMGFAHLWVGDHLIFPKTLREEKQGFTQGNFLESVTTMTYAAAVTQNILIGTSVTILPYHNPILVARQMATLDILSGGRLILGVGVGHMVGEFSALGVPFEERGPRTDEYLDLMIKLWTSETRVDFHGRFFDFEEIRFPSPPVQKPYIPLWIGGDSDACFRRVARIGDAWHPQGHRPAALKEKVNRLREFVEDAGRSMADLTICLCRGFEMMDTAHPNPSERRPLIGTPDEWLEDVEAYKDAGATEMRLEFRSLDVDDHLRNMDKLANGVLARLK
jgi:probable F420-dependent oxidoreductase